eukprot:jgi/Mesvir1/8677/Mv02618-RA.1
MSSFICPRMTLHKHLLVLASVCCCIFSACSLNVTVEGACAKDAPVVVVFATVPRSGNSWTRALVEAATGIRTETIYASPNRPNNHPLYGTRSARCEGHLSFRACRYKGARRASANDPVLIKQHYPFLPEKYNITSHKATFFLNSIRNPVDNCGAFQDYLRRKHHGKNVVTKFPEFAKDWASFFDYWAHPDDTDIKATPRHVFRYEDLLSNTQQTLSEILNATCFYQKLSLTQDDVARAVRLFPPQPHKQLESLPEVVDVTEGVAWLFKNHRGLLERYGYASVLEPLLPGHKKRM